MNPGKLSDGVNTGENWPVPVDEVIEPSRVRNGERRDLTQEEQQFADLLHGCALFQSDREVCVPPLPPTPSRGGEGEPNNRWFGNTPSPLAGEGRGGGRERLQEEMESNHPLFNKTPVEDRGAERLPFIPIQERPVPATPFTRPDSALETFPIDRPAFVNRGHLQNEPLPVAIQTVDLRYPALPLPKGKASRETPDTTPIDANPVLPSGDRILQGLFGQPYPSAPLATPSPVSSSDRMDQLAERLAQRILVSDRTHTSDSEVRIQLRETVLQGAEITFRRDQGQLVVSFNVVDAHVAQQLSPQTDDLQRILATRLDTSVRIEVNVSSGETSGQGSPGDGRSRNRRDPRDEWGMDY